ncbi:signal peptidase I [Nocardioides zeae]|uniref:Signal peptidase I n=1 Tax=Nocardioides imazamoxiresistens TaxID=3231893 RepID=A0ABU3PYJ2_9ACTN|nr:signal peptidase I [Nocardioides zeae]MDT9593877.1 signal peptidase I [Nocardioides zeae]
MTTDDRESPTSSDEDVDSRSSSSPARRRRKQLPLWQETILLLGIAVVLAIVIKSFFLQAFYIPSVSMTPGLQVDDRILVEKPSYWFDGPERGDVVVFEDPGGWLSDSADTGPENVLSQALSKIGLYPTGGHLVKRVIGVGGDVVACCDDQGRILVNGEPLDEPYLEEGLECNGPEQGTCTPAEGDELVWETVEVPEGHLFLLGDNRGNSEDSAARMCRDDPNNTTLCTPGPEFVDEDLVVGRVFSVAWPRDHWRWVSRPATFEDLPAP